MIIVEILAGVAIAVAVLLNVGKLVTPIVDAFVNRLQRKFQELAPEEERQIFLRMSAMEEEIRVLKKQMSDTQDSLEFATRIQVQNKA